MTPNGGQPKKDADPSEGRRPYSAPQLRRLGSVRELTLGMSGNEAEGLFMKQPKNAM